jgi:DNA-binding transcriptional regulator YhcF (GntR family)
VAFPPTTGIEYRYCDADWSTSGKASRSVALAPPDLHPLRTELMKLSVDPESPVPPFEQVRAKIAADIDAGVLAPETRLPTVRQLAADLDLAVNTVARSYRELELAGFIETRGRQGTFVAGPASGSRRSAVRAARQFARRMQELGVGEAESLAIVRREIEAQFEASGDLDADMGP